MHPKLSQHCHSHCTLCPDKKSFLEIEFVTSTFTDQCDGFCLNGGTCLRRSVTLIQEGQPLPSAVSCTCPPQYTGIQCQNPITGRYHRGIQYQNPVTGQYHMGIQCQNPITGQYHMGIQCQNPTKGQYHMDTQCQNPTKGQYHMDIQGQNPTKGQYHIRIQCQNPTTGQYQNKKAFQ